MVVLSPFPENKQGSMNNGLWSPTQDHIDIVQGHPQLAAVTQNHLSQKHHTGGSSSEGGTNIDMMLEAAEQMNY